MYIQLFGKNDRLGGNITNFIAQIIYAIHHKLYIRYNRATMPCVAGDYDIRYNTSIFVLTLFDFIDKHNAVVGGDNDGQKVDITTNDYFAMMSRVVLDIKCDLISYFRKNVLDMENFGSKSKLHNYVIPFDPHQTILVHLRLDDMRHAPDYDGRICTNYLKAKINNDEIVNMDTHYGMRRFITGNYNHQAPLSKHKIQTQIDKARQKYPHHKVIIITNPGENTSEYPYECIQNKDASLDLFLLCSSDVVILSRSTFAVSCLFFGIAKEVYIPLWGHLPCFGLSTKYDMYGRGHDTSINYFY